MSFMFHPFPYADPDAVNVVSGQGVKPVRGIHAVAGSIAALLKEGHRVGLEAYPGADIGPLVNVIRQQCALPDGGSEITFVDAASLLKSPKALTELLREYLPEDRENDPVLLYGRRYLDGYGGLQREEAVSALRDGMQEGTLVYGCGALTEALQECY